MRHIGAYAEGLLQARHNSARGANTLPAECRASWGANPRAESLSHNGARIRDVRDLRDLRQCIPIAFLCSTNMVLFGFSYVTLYRRSLRSLRFSDLDTMGMRLAP